MPYSIPYSGSKLQVGMIAKWKVLVWDSKGVGPSSSTYSKFGVGPREWTGKWITHSQDLTNYKQVSTNMWDYSFAVGLTCAAWKQ